MQKRVYFRVGILLALISGWSAAAWSVSDYYSTSSPQNKTIRDSDEENVLIQGENRSIPRNQVLLEVITGTW